MSLNHLTPLHLEIVIVFGQMKLSRQVGNKNFPSILGYKENFAMGSFIELP
jgi:hypothetical protein